MNLERPDLSLVSPDVKAYIEALEAELAATRKSPPHRARASQMSLRNSTSRANRPPRSR